MDIFLITFLVSLGIISLILILKYLRLNFKLRFLSVFSRKNLIIDQATLEKYKNIPIEAIMAEAEKYLRCGDFKRAEILFRIAKKKENKESTVEIASK
jgi:hypothetical protein